MHKFKINDIVRLRSDIQISQFDSGSPVKPNDMGVVVELYDEDYTWPIKVRWPRTAGILGTIHKIVGISKDYDDDYPYRLDLPDNFKGYNLWNEAELELVYEI